MAEPDQSKAHWWIIGVLTACMTALMLGGLSNAMDRMSELEASVMSHSHQPSHPVQSQVNAQIVESMAHMAVDIGSNRASVSTIHDTQIRHGLILDSHTETLSHIKKALDDIKRGKTQ